MPRDHARFRLPDLRPVYRLVPRRPLPTTPAPGDFAREILG
jgi:hypothetical protein